jgi:hypothetical protein
MEKKIPGDYDRRHHDFRHHDLMTPACRTGAASCGNTDAGRSRAGSAVEMFSSGWSSLRIGLSVVLSLGMVEMSASRAEPPVTETIVLIRHGEKPTEGLGQLNCQGLNRALALPFVIERLFGKPNAMFAPDPAQSKEDHGRPYNYVRPLATIEPAAILFGLPVDASVGFADIGTLRHKLESSDYRSAVVVVAWEHHEIEKLARQLVTAHGGDPASVPDWQDEDFDSIYVVKLAQTDAGTTVSFELRHEGLDGKPAACPGQAAQ